PTNTYTLLFLQSYPHHRHLHSFPTRRSSDLDLPPEELANVPSVPDSLSGAIAALENDHDFLLKGDVFNSDFITNWLEMKQKEYDALRLRPHPYEFSMYYDV